MFRIFRLVFGHIVRSFYSRNDLLMENLLLRQQLPVLKRRNQRPWLSAVDRLFWVLARRFWTGWKKSLILQLREAFRFAPSHK
jgi:hypothetical protein